MKHKNPLTTLSLRLVVMIGLLLGGHAQADEYGDVSQLVRAGKLPEAMARADQYLASQPKDPQMRFIKGVIQRDSGKTADAIATFTRLTEDYPELPEPYNNLAVLYAGQSQFDKARNALETAIRTNPSYATAHENLGDIYAKLASQAYNKALQLDADNQAVPPKLALIREIVSPGKGGRPASASPAAAAAPPAQTSPAPAPSPTAAAPAAAEGEAKQVEAAIAIWVRAWSTRDIKTYLAAYGPEFVPPGGVGRKAWEEERQQRILGKASISVKVDQLNVAVNGVRAVAKFQQDYRSGALSVSNGKTLEFAKVAERWLIVKETVNN